MKIDTLTINATQADEILSSQSYESIGCSQVLHKVGDNYVVFDYEQELKNIEGDTIKEFDVVLLSQSDWDLAVSTISPIGALNTAIVLMQLGEETETSFEETWAQEGFADAVADVFKSSSLKKGDRKFLNRKAVQCALLYIFIGGDFSPWNPVAIMSREFLDILLNADDIKSHCDALPPEPLPCDKIILAREVAEGTVEDYGNDTQKIRKITNHFRQWQKQFITA
tara:strand:- start:331 stop:1005 length:675 start_codon:yes stop_codon:yes gene_type:complete